MIRRRTKSLRDGLLTVPLSSLSIRLKISENNVGIGQKRLKIHMQIHRDFLLLGQSKILCVDNLEAQQAVLLSCLLSLLLHKTFD